MADFSWPAFLQRYRVPYNTRGPNTPNGCVTVQCPFCGSADPSDHMVLWPNNGWRCWRNHSHGGKHPARLVQALIRCSADEARRLTATVKAANPRSLEEIATMLAPPSAPIERVLDWPDDLKPLDDSYGCRLFVRYLNDRGINLAPAVLAKRYGIRYAKRGLFRGRVVFPVAEDGKLISWTGRSIYKDEELRYLSLTVDPERAAKHGLEPALAQVNSHFMWHDLVCESRCDTFVLVEGPMDALKINVLGSPHVISTCWTGSEPTKRQVKLLHRLARPFKRRLVISDSEMPEKGEQIAADLAALGFEARRLPPPIDDPGEIPDRRALFRILG